MFESDSRRTLSCHETEQFGSGSVRHIFKSAGVSGAVFSGAKICSQVSPDVLLMSHQPEQRESG